MGRIKPESFWLGCPGFADVFVGRKALEGLEPPGEVVGCDEVAEMAAELVVTVVVVTLDGGILDGPIHALDLAVGPRVMRFGQTVLDAVVLASPVERMPTHHRGWTFPVLR